MVHDEGVQTFGACRLPGEPGEVDGSHMQGKEDVHTDFDGLYRRWFHEVCRWARSLGGLHADVEDIAQEVFIVVRRKLDQFDGQHPRAWLYRITQRAAGDYRRRAWWRRTVRPGADFLNQVVDPGGGPRRVVQMKEAEVRVARILDKMSVVRRSAFILHEIEGYTGEEIAELEGVPVATVYTRLFHARKDFFRLLARQGPSPMSQEES